MFIQLKNSEPTKEIMMVMPCHRPLKNQATSQFDQTEFTSTFGQAHQLKSATEDKIANTLKSRLLIL